jgi:uncharacterized protein (DUF488 family)
VHLPDVGEMCITHLNTYHQDETGIFTIGYEGRSINQFLSILEGNHITKLIDVRNNPFSMKPGYSKNQLAKALENRGISYLHIPELGIESRRRRNLTKKGATSLFQCYGRELDSKESIIDRIRVMAQKEKVALMCFEANVHICHRNVIAERFRKKGICVIDL